MIDIIIVGISTYAIATYMVEHDGAFNVFKRIRGFGEVFECRECLIVWIAILPSLALRTSIMGYIAAIGIALIITRIEQ